MDEAAAAAVDSGLNGPGLAAGGGPPDNRLMSAGGPLDSGLASAVSKRPRGRLAVGTKGGAGGLLDSTGIDLTALLLAWFLCACL